MILKQILKEILNNMNKWNLKYNPRKWQLEALTNWKKNYKGVASVATAGGKTFFSFLCINEYLKLNPNSKIIILVPTIPLLDQWKISLMEEFGVSENDISLGGGGNKFKKVNLFNILVNKTASKLLNNIDFDANKFMLVADECHKTGTESVRVVFDHEYDAALGLSATPRREYDSFFEDYVSPTLGDIIYSYSYDQALSDGVIPNFELINIKIWSNSEEDEEIKNIKIKIAKQLSIITKSQSISSQAAFNSPIIQNLNYKLSRQNKNLESRIMMTIKLLITSTYNKAIIFHESIKEVEKINNYLNAKGIRSLGYHSKLSGNNRFMNLKKFRLGIARVLVTCEALDEGLNVPSIDLAIISAGNLSKRQRIQRLGRTLRTSDGKEKATIYTLYFTDQEKIRLVEEEEKMNDTASVKWLVAKGN